MSPWRGRDAKGISIMLQLEQRPVTGIQLLASERDISYIYIRFLFVTPNIVRPR